MNGWIRIWSASAFNPSSKPHFKNDMGNGDMLMYVFIVNPVAGNGRAKRIFKRLEKTDPYKSIQTSVHMTNNEGHAEKIATELTASGHAPITCIIVIGGDGTLHEVVNGLRECTIPLSFIPGGSGNDFARGVGIKGTPEKILSHAINGENNLPYWTGTYRADEQKSRQFVNSMGFGFDAEIAEQSSRGPIKHILNRLHMGTLNYIGALVQVLWRFKPFSVELELDGEKQTIDDCWMVTIANHPYYGGGMKIIPNAPVNPDTLHILVLRSISKWKVFALFLTIFTGRHLRFKEVSVMEASHIKVRGKGILPFHVDGQPGSCMETEITKTQRSLRVLAATSRKK